MGKGAELKKKVIPVLSEEACLLGAFGQTRKTTSICLRVKGCCRGQSSEEIRNGVLQGSGSRNCSW